LPTVSAKVGKNVKATRVTNWAKANMLLE